MCKELHMLIGGTTGAGKSVLTSTIIDSLIERYKDNPEKSHYLKKRLKIQRDKYKENKPESKVYNTVRRKKEKHYPIIRFNYGDLIINFN